MREYVEFFGLAGIVCGGVTPLEAFDDLGGGVTGFIGMVLVAICWTIGVVVFSWAIVGCLLHQLWKDLTS